ncbi:MAG TPA: ABC transporter ATP-binding protein [Bacilli bacterium]|jgi:spermidine/putrescine transport system ATP-binding protein|nr:ABC transporter ATP-binding protein [Bacilli bacterium]NLT02071.1 ABC transporter ATP-binding protein [Acholeplasmataceae bacterium]HNZ77498.1 ABC transporter ATP-binding protein [Bacilli bacterium]HOD61409.1 ABC transporter ATP-binding protein [Bacilli bacterium]HOE06343.1 ABC transporter ATP-binding protein [Bacilli bacterium]
MKKKNVIIELIGVSKQFNGNTVVDDFNLYVKKGEFITFLGPSGCGKTTTLRMIAGFEMPTTGKILLNGQDITLLPPFKRPVNTVFQRYALFPHYDVYDNIAFGLKMKKIKETKVNKKGETIEIERKLTVEEIDEKVTKALKIVDLEEFEARDISTLSGGQQQRVAIARAIVNEPEILLLDEPLGALDLKMRKEMQLELKAMHKKLGITFIYVTHDQEEALTMSDTIVVMNDGIIQQIGTPTDIYNEPKNAFVADFIGESNLYNGTITDEKKVLFINHVFDMVDDFEKNEKVDVIVRPEDIFLMEKDIGMVNGKLVSKIFKGVYYEYTMMVGKNEVIIHDTKEHDINQTMSIYIKPFDIHIMKKDFISNVYEGHIDKNNKVVFAEGEFECDVTQLIPNSTLDEDGYLVDAKGVVYDLTDAPVKVEVGLKDIDISDNEEEGNVVGQIVSIIYKGDHYQVIVRTKDYDDFVVDTEYLWNEFDTVSIAILPENIKMTLKQEAKNYVKD